MPVVGNGELARAIRMLQKKIMQLDEEFAGDYDHPLDTEEELNADAPAPPTATKSMPKQEKDEIQYYYVM